MSNRNAVPDHSPGSRSAPWRHPSHHPSVNPEGLHQHAPHEPYYPSSSLSASACLRASSVRLVHRCQSPHGNQIEESSCRAYIQSLASRRSRRSIVRRRSVEAASTRRTAATTPPWEEPRASLVRGSRIAAGRGMRTSQGRRHRSGRDQPGPHRVQVDVAADRPVIAYGIRTRGRVTRVLRTWRPR
jgi:hypothetical protein